MRCEPTQDVIERHCAKCGKLLVTLRLIDPKAGVWKGESVRYIKGDSSQYVCRDCNEPDIPQDKKPSGSVSARRKPMPVPPSPPKKQK